MTDVQKKHKVLIVDDTPANLQILMEILKNDYQIAAAKDGQRALKIAAIDPRPDIVLLDIMMPEMDGYEVCSRLKADENTRDIPVIFITALSELEDEAKGLEMGAIDYITKPISPPIVQARVKNHLELKQAREFLKDQNVILEERVEERTKEVIDLQKVEFDLRAAKEKVENELNIAAEIQKSILPSTFPAYPERGEFDLHAFMQPARFIGGDFYDFFLVDDHTLAVVMADVSDKGVPAALFMMVSRTLIKSLAGEYKSPGVVLEKANNILCQSNDSVMFVTIFLAFYDIPTGELTAASGGHHPGIIIDPGGTSWEWSVANGPALGFMPQARFTDASLGLDIGHTLFLYTDGVTEAMSPQRRLFGLEQFQALLKANSELTLNGLCIKIESTLSAFQEGQQFDDITLLGLKRIK